MEQQNPSITVAILEDDEALRMLLTEMCKLWGMSTITFKSGYDAAAWLDTIEAGADQIRLPDVALLDIRVPGPQGPEIAHRMRQMPATSQIPIVIMTAYRLNPEEKEQLATVAQPDAFLLKGDMLMEEIQQTLQSTVAAHKKKITE